MTVASRYAPTPPFNRQSTIEHAPILPDIIKQAAQLRKDGRPAKAAAISPRRVSVSL